MKVKTRTCHTVELDDDTELEIPLRPEEYAAVDPTFCLSSADPTKAVLVYTVYDSDCPNPLEDCDRLGKIYHHPRSRCGWRNEGSEYLDALGLDGYGNPIVDENKLQQRWHDKVMALSLQTFFITPELREITDAETLREQLANENIVGDYGFTQDARSAWRDTIQHDDADQDQIDALIDQVEDALDWNYEREAEACYVGPSPYAVLLDVYEHGGRAYSVSGLAKNRGD